MDMTLILQSVTASAPEIIIITGACVALMLSLVPQARLDVILGLFSLAVIILAAIMSYMLPRLLTGDAPQTVYAGMFVVDEFSTFFKLVLYLGAGLTILMSGKYLIQEHSLRGEYHVLLLFALCGMMIMASGVDLLIIYVGLELQALSIYILTGFLKASARSNEAALKYVILGAFSSGIFLYGLSLFYGLTGTTQLAGMAEIFNMADVTDPMLIMATLFMLVGLLFKVGAVPFHMWAPDIYEGAPSPVTGFMSVAAKAAAFAVILRIFIGHLGVLQPIWFANLAAIAILTMGLGSFVALVQDNIKRLLAYSSIAHAGFLLLGLLAGGRDGAAGIMFYLLVYTLMNLGIFAIIVILNRGAARGEPIEDFAGLAKKNAGLAFMAMVFLLSLAGIPPTGGFFAKFYILVALIEAGYVALAVIAVLLSAVAAWFYIRIIMVMYVRPPAPPRRIGTDLPLKLVLLVTFLGTILTGLVPAWFLGLLDGFVNGVGFG